MTPCVLCGVIGKACPSPCEHHTDERKCRKPEEAETGFACPSCAVRLAAIPTEIADAYGWLAWALLRPESGKRGDGRAASPDPALPFPVDAHDLLDEDRAAPSGPLALERLEANADLQVGYASVASQVGTWVRDWAERRGLRELADDAEGWNVAHMCEWLTVRTPWACDNHPAVDEYAADIQQLRGVLFALVGRPEPDERPVPLAGVPCVRCRRVTLVRDFRDDGTSVIRCTWPDCMRVYNEAEWNTASKAMAHAARRGQISKEDAA